MVQINSLSALQPLQQPSSLTETPAAPRADAPQKTSDVDAAFSAFLERSIAETAAQLRQSEATSVAAMRGEASVQDVVEEVMSAERKLQLAISVRDKVVQAYLEVSRMAI